MLDYVENLFKLKLQSWYEVAMLASLLLLTVAGAALYTIMINRKRNDENAAQRVGKRLTRLSGNATVFSNLTIRLSESPHHFDFLMIDSQGILVVKSFGRGVYVKGNVDDEDWRISDRIKWAPFKNPLIALQEETLSLRQTLQENGVSDVLIEYLVVFADQHEPTKFSLGKAANVINYQTLKKWYRSRTNNEAERFDAGNVVTLIRSLQV